MFKLFAIKSEFDVVGEILIETENFVTFKRCWEVIYVGTDRGSLATKGPQKGIELKQLPIGTLFHKNAAYLEIICNEKVWGYVNKGNKE